MEILYFIVLWTMILYGFTMTTILSITLAQTSSTFDDVEDVPRNYAAYELAFMVCLLSIALFSVLYSKFYLREQIERVLFPCAGTDASPRPRSIAMYLTSTVCGIACVFSFVVFNIRLDGINGTGPGSCIDASFIGCPTTQAVDVYGLTINDVNDCIFNAWENTNQYRTPSINGNTTLIDWSVQTYYDPENAVETAAALNSNCPDTGECIFRTPPLNMPSITDCWNWGCHAICNKERFDANQTWLSCSVVNGAVYAGLAILSLLSGLYGMDELGSKPMPIAVAEPVAALVDTNQQRPSSLSSSKRRSMSSDRSRRVTFRI